MFQYTNKTAPALSRATIGKMNCRCEGAYGKNTVFRLNEKLHKAATPQRTPEPAPNPHPILRKPPEPVGPATPLLQHPLQKGQKVALGQQVRCVQVRFGWRAADDRCDVDASAFLIDERGKVPGDAWFVFYGQPQSPDRSVRLSDDASGADRKVMDVDLTKVHPGIRKIVLVLTINEAFVRCLHFGMVRDAYVRLMDGASGGELYSYRLDEGNPNITSMTIGELYLHNGQWKFNPVGSGVRRDLAGQCAIYGVEIE